jgi:hypothetical protein
MISNQNWNKILYRDAIFCFPQKIQIYTENKEICGACSNQMDENIDPIMIRVLDKNNESFKDVTIYDYIRRDNIMDNRYDVCNDKDIIFYNEASTSEYLIACDDGWASLCYNIDDFVYKEKISLSKISDTLKKYTFTHVCDPKIITLPLYECKDEGKGKSINVYKTNILNSSKLDSVFCNSVCLCDRSIVFERWLKLREI